MKKPIMFMVGLVLTQFSFAQAPEKKQYEVKNFSGMVKINGPSKNLSINGYDGSSVIIEAETGEGSLPEKANGLKIVTSGGIDNTGIAVHVEDYKTKVITSVNEDGVGKEEEVRALEINIPNSNNSYKNYSVKVPRNVKVVFNENNQPFFEYQEGSLTISQLDNELEINCLGCNLNVINFSGNIISNNSWGGKTRVEFLRLSQKKISSINSGGEVEVILPADSKANLVLDSKRGNVFTDFDLRKAPREEVIVPDGNMDISFGPNGFVKSYPNAASTHPSDAKRAAANYPTKKGTTAQTYVIEARPPVGKTIRGVSSLNGFTYTIGDNRTDRYDYTINGGGVYLNVSSDSGDIYLRKK